LIDITNYSFNESTTNRFLGNSRISYEMQNQIAKSKDIEKKVSYGLVEDSTKTNFIEVDGKNYPLGVFATGAHLFHREGFTGKDCIVGVIDSGVSKHKDFTNLYEIDFLPEDKNRNDHGTHVAGIIAANRDLTGVSPKVTLKSYRMFGSKKDGLLSDEIKALKEAKKDGCHIICMSLGGLSTSEEEENWIKEVSKTALIVCASGNSGREGNRPEYPAFFEEVVSVGSCDFDFSKKEVKPAKSSSYNEQVDVCADGVDVYSTVGTHEYKSYSGTSMAAPHVAGFAALLWEKWMYHNGKPPNPSELKKLIENQFTIDVHTKGDDFQTGKGFVSAFKSLEDIKK
jgi:subtilisin family serine protease